MTSEVTRHVQQSKEALEETIRIISELKYLDNHESYLGKYSDLVEGLLEAENIAESYKKAYLKAAGAQSMAQFDELYQREMSQIQPQPIKQTSQYQEMMDMANDYFTIAVGGDIQPTNTTLDDDLAIEENIPTIDPLTKGPLENPVKNKICGHIYGKLTMQKAIKQGNIRCPQMGCMNKQNVALSHLVDDPKLRKQLVAMRATQQQMDQDEEDDSD